MTLNNWAVNRWKTLPDLTQPFLVCDDTIRTYEQVGLEIERIHRLLKQHHIKSYQTIGLSSSSPCHFAVALLALLAWDLVVVPLNPKAPREEWQRQLKEAHCGVWLHDDKDQVVNSRWTLESEIKDAEEPWQDNFSGMILFTSGSTGHPKTVGLAQDQLWEQALTVKITHHLTEDSRGYSPLPLFHVNAPVIALFSTFLAGGTLILDPFNRQTFWNTVQKQDVNWINAVPAILTILSHQAHQLPINHSPHHASLHFIRSASAPLGHVLLERIEEQFGVPVIESYGMTEACGPITVNTGPLLQRGPAGSVGRPKNIMVRLINSEVWIKGGPVIRPHLAMNAWALSEMTGEWYHTGDLGHFDEQGYLYLDGRVKDVIKRGGESIFPREVEEILHKDKRVQECVVVGRPHPVLGEEPVAYIVSSDPEIEEALRALSAQHLSPYKRPVAYHFVETLPKNATGKIQRRMLVKEGQHA
ncbi:AMP-binding protein [Sulfobacillus thermosulfidooxidans]|uniref:AMP-binding protein n=1 Tax=Sulfobacillus thermosulfidooxidans TaxID=28034 RepID=UPI00031B31E5|nr:AMP-binding protein [Sulfobacillus thermosulfidooxidans]